MSWSHQRYLPSRSLTLIPPKNSERGETMTSNLILLSDLLRHRMKDCYSLTASFLWQMIHHSDTRTLITDFLNELYWIRNGGCNFFSIQLWFDSSQWMWAFEVTLFANAIQQSLLKPIHLNWGFYWLKIDVTPLSQKFEKKRALSDWWRLIVISCVECQRVFQSAYFDHWID